MNDPILQALKDALGHLEGREFWQTMDRVYVAEVYVKRPPFDDVPRTRLEDPLQRKLGFWLIDRLK